MLATHKQLKSDVTIFLSIVVIFIVIGMIFIYSSSSVFALEKIGSAHYYIKKQLIGCMIGIPIAWATQYITLNRLKLLSPYFLLFSLGLTALTLVPALAKPIHGSSRWLNTPLLSFQPSELLKISLILYAAYFLSKKEKRHKTFLIDFIPLLILLLFTACILLQQPDFGLTVTLVSTVLLMIFVFGNFNRYLGLTLLTIIPIVIVLIGSKSYRLKRILIFLDPWSDAQGAGFQIIQSLIAIGSGGFWGLGIGQSKQKFFYLPMQHTDFIFSIIAEETGFIGASIVIFLFVLFFYFGLRIALHMSDRFSLLAITGFVSVISLQGFINICVATGLAPTKGIGLPFISYGNTALVCQLIMIGLIISIAGQNQQMRTAS
jgi:cell division protein FtsW